MFDLWYEQFGGFSAIFILLCIILLFLNAFNVCAMTRSCWRWPVIFKLMLVVTGVLRLSDAQLTEHAEDEINLTAFLDELARITDDNLGVSYMQVQLNNFRTCIYPGVMLSSTLPRRLQISAFFFLLCN